MKGKIVEDPLGVCNPQTCTEAHGGDTVRRLRRELKDRNNFPLGVDSLRAVR